MGFVNREDIPLTNGQQAIVAELRPEDGQSALALFREIAEEKVFLLTDPDEIQIQSREERRFLQNIRNSENSVALGAWVDGILAGTLTLLGPGRRKQAHVASLGMAVRKSFRRLGVGRALLKEGVKWAQKHPILSVIQLSAFATNKGALSLYHSLGFTLDGKRPASFRIADVLVEEVLMSLWVGDGSPPPTSFNGLH